MLVYLISLSHVKHMALEGKCNFWYFIFQNEQHVNGNAAGGGATSS